MRLPFYKLTHGYVEQVFDANGKCIEQRFVASDDVTWEGANLRSINPEATPLRGREHFPFGMIQPK